ncbi:hypothetical protein QFZ42_004158 [Variovorax paradoxus]|uniref:hypothetical protein n=1 Tax=Variovorax paradoxus TaxID=34073 RepID=UPI00278D5228|nr:hypothetical protein [Variovorax paradoxus]MDQ0572324.1 hypothetical protein [Variovorax paradoxus]
MATVVKKSSPVVLSAFSRSGRPENHAFDHYWVQSAIRSRSKATLSKESNGDKIDLFEDLAGASDHWMLIAAEN